jgi:hypothetical protein
LDIESGEESMVSMLLTQSVFLGIFIGAFDITAHSLLLSAFDEKMLARGYMVSGIAGVLVTSVYFWFLPRVKFRNFTIIILLCCHNPYTISLVCIDFSTVKTNNIHYFYFAWPS